MPYDLQTTEAGLVLELSDGVTVRDAAQLSLRLASCVATDTCLCVRTNDLEDIDTSILQILVSLRKTVESFILDDPSEVFIHAVARCALQRELLTGLKDAA